MAKVVEVAPGIFRDPEMTYISARTGMWCIGKKIQEKDNKT